MVQKAANFKGLVGANASALRQKQSFIFA